MSLADLIRGKARTEPPAIATAIAAIPATEEHESVRVGSKSSKSSSGLCPDAETAAVQAVVDEPAVAALPSQAEASLSSPIDAGRLRTIGADRLRLLYAVLPEVGLADRELVMAAAVADPALLAEWLERAGPRERWMAEQDDRRFCWECRHLAGRGTCLEWRSVGWLELARVPLDRLHRCRRFEPRSIGFPTCDGWPLPVTEATGAEPMARAAPKSSTSADASSDRTPMATPPAVPAPPEGTRP